MTTATATSTTTASVPGSASVERNHPDGSSVKRYPFRRFTPDGRRLYAMPPLPRKVWERFNGNGEFIKQLAKSMRPQPEQRDPSVIDGAAYLQREEDGSTSWTGTTRYSVVTAN